MQYSLSIMKRLLAVLALSAVGCMSAFAGEFTGYISDEQCASGGSSKHSAAEWIVPSKFEECVKKCVKEGSTPVFVTEDNKILKIDAESMKKITAHLGHKVTVSGSIHGETVKIDKIESMKM
jgi:hypothetical protein